MQLSAGWMQAGSEPVTVTLTNGSSAHYAVSRNTCSFGTDAARRGPLSFPTRRSSDLTGHASSTLSDLGTASAVTVQTDGTGQNGSDAVKTFVDARIHISPSEIGSAHD